MTLATVGMVWRTPQLLSGSTPRASRWLQGNRGCRLSKKRPLPGLESTGQRPRVSHAPSPGSALTLPGSRAPWCSTTRGRAAFLHVADEDLVQPHREPEEPVRGVVREAGQEGLGHADEQLAVGAAPPPGCGSAPSLSDGVWSLPGMGAPRSGPLCINRKAGPNSPSKSGAPGAAHAPDQVEARVSTPCGPPPIESVARTSAHVSYLRTRNRCTRGNCTSEGLHGHGP